MFISNDSESKLKLQDFHRNSLRCFRRTECLCGDVLKQRKTPLGVKSEIRRLWKLINSLRAKAELQYWFMSAYSKRHPATSSNRVFLSSHGSLLNSAHYFLKPFIATYWALTPDEKSCWRFPPWMSDGGRLASAARQYQSRLLALDCEMLSELDSELKLAGDLLKGGISKEADPRTITESTSQVARRNLTKGQERDIEAVKIYLSLRDAGAKCRKAEVARRLDPPVKPQLLSPNRCPLLDAAFRADRAKKDPSQRVIRGAIEGGRLDAYVEM